MSQRPNIALYEPDIPQNTAAIIRTCACLGAKLEIIEPCGFHLSDKRFKRVVMDYMDLNKIEIHQSAEKFFEAKKNQRVVLMTTKASVSYLKFKFEKFLCFDLIFFKSNFICFFNDLAKLFMSFIEIFLFDSLDNISI